MTHQPQGKRERNRAKRSPRALRGLVIRSSVAFWATLLFTLSALSTLTAHAVADDSWSRALAKRDLPAIERLVAAGADVNRANGDGMTALMVAAAERNQGLLRLLLERGARVNAANDRGGTPLMYSATAGDLNAVAFLLSRGAAIDARATNGWTALTLAAARGFDEVANLLLRRGADPNVTDIYGWTPLMRAVQHDRQAVVRVLLGSNRVKLDVQNESGHTALHQAALEGFTDIAGMLVARGANTGLLDHSGRTSAALALATGHRTTARIIDKAAAKN